MATRRGLSISLENTEDIDTNDNLEVTKAIEIVESTTDVDDIDALAAKQEEVIAQQKELDKKQTEEVVGEEPTEGEFGEAPVGDDINSDEDNADLNELGETLNDAVSLEALIAKFSSDTVTTESFDCKSLAIVLEAGSISSTVWSALEKVWKKLVEFVTRIAETVDTFIKLQKSKLNTAKEELDKLKTSITKIDAASKPRRETIEGVPMAQLLTTNPDKNDVKEMMDSMIGQVKMVGSYFNHVRAHFNPYIASVNNLFGNSEKFPEYIEGNLLIGRNTLPSVMTKVVEITGYRKPVPTQDVYRSAWMPKGTIIASFVTNDTKVLFGTKRDTSSHSSVQTDDAENTVLHSKTMLCLDHEYSTDVSELPVMTRSELFKYVDEMEHLRQVLSQAEGLLMIYAKAIGELKKQIVNASRDAAILAKSEKSEEVMVQAQGKRVQGQALTATMMLTEMFYGRPSLSMMQFNNTILSASVKYCIDCINAYTYVKKKESEDN